MSENEEKKNTAAELPDEALDMVAGGSGGHGSCFGYCPYCGVKHPIYRTDDHTMRSGRIAETYRCKGKGRTFYKVGERYFDVSERPLR